MNKIYVAFYDNAIRESSSSGGIFSLLAQHFDVVYGVAMTADNYGAKFVRTENDTSTIRGSKYLQASMGDTYLDVKNDLFSQKTVFFCGTICQVNGLKNFLGKEFDNLFCVDVVCHGVPSPALWEIYIKHQENVYGKKVRSVNFRCKEWKTLEVQENSAFISKDADAYMQMFLRNYCLRPSCYNCKAKQDKQSDISIGDFWGIENVAPEMDDNKGVSCVIVRSEKAVVLFEQLRSKLHCKEVSYEDAVKQNPSEFSSTNRPPERDVFFDDMNLMSFSELTQKYVGTSKASVLRKIKRKIKSILVRKNINLAGWKNYGIKFIFCDNQKRVGEQ